MRHTDDALTNAVHTLVTQLHTLHPDFSLDECAELCRSYCDKFNAKTKPDTIITSLAKRLHSDFDVPFDDGMCATTRSGFSTVPAHLFGEKQKTPSPQLLLE